MTNLKTLKRQGVTLLELLVVMSILTVIVGLILVGIQQARASANRVGGANNLRQLGVAFNSYHTLKNRFPTEIGASSPNAMTSGATAQFVKTDAATAGNWNGVYGGDGYLVCLGGVSLPSYIYGSAGSSAAAYCWNQHTTDDRALFIPGGNGREATCWYTAGLNVGASFTINANLADGQTHQVALYAVDWDNDGPRSERIDVLNAGGTVLDSQTLSSFQSGKYLIWNVSGNVQFRVTNLVQGSNAVVSGLFFGGAGPTTGTSSSRSSLTSSTSGTSLYTALLPYVEQQNAQPTTAISGYLDPARRSTSVGAKRDFGYASSNAYDSQGPSILDQPTGVRQADVASGLASTYLLTSLWMNPGTYSGGDWTDVGWVGTMNARTVGATIKRDSDPSGTNQYLGGAHAGALPILYADGHVAGVSYQSYTDQWAYAASNGSSPTSSPTSTGNSSSPGPGTATSPLMPSGGSASAGYSFDSTSIAAALQQSATPDWVQMAADANTMMTLANKPNVSLSELLTAVELALKYSPYISTYWSMAGRLEYDGYQLQYDLAHGAASTADQAYLIWVLGGPDDVGAGLAKLAAHHEDYVPGEVFIDPDIATGYDYSSSVNFKSVLIPKPLPGGQSKFELVVGKQTFPLEAGKRFFFTTDFPDGVNAFTIRGIDVSEELDAANMTAFVTGVSFMQEGPAEVKMLPLVKRSWLATGWGLAGSLTGLLLVGTFFTGFAWRRRTSRAA